MKTNDKDIGAQEVAWLTAWNGRVKPLADASGKSAAEINEALKNVVGDPSATALELLANVEVAKTGDLRRYLCDKDEGGLGIPTCRCSAARHRSCRRCRVVVLLVL